jgi:hypothetical protein
MKRQVFLGAIIFLSLWMGQSFAHVSEISLDDYHGGLSPKWAEKSFQGKTQYEAVQEEGQWFIRATSKASASALYYEISYDLQEYPILTWRWKVDEIRLQNQDRNKAQEDCPARVYVVFPAPLIWRSKAVSYIWTHRVREGETAAPQCVDSLVEIALQSGDKQAGEWIDEERNVLEDYRKYFGEDPPKVGAIAIMTDMDHTGGKATASYGPIRIVSRAVW